MVSSAKRLSRDAGKEEPDQARITKSHRNSDAEEALAAELGSHCSERMKPTFNLCSATGAIRAKIATTAWLVLLNALR